MPIPVQTRLPFVCSSNADLDSYKGRVTSISVVTEAHLIAADLARLNEHLLNARGRACGATHQPANPSLT